jgi:hypothetical protein
MEEFIISDPLLSNGGFITLSNGGIYNILGYMEGYITHWGGGIYITLK